MNVEATFPRFSRPAAIVAVASTYFYFLIFAEFALLELAKPFAAGPAGIKPALTVLGAAGIMGSFAGAAWFRPARASQLLAWLFRGAALGAILAATASSRLVFLGACALSGFALGGLTVVLSASLRAATGTRRLGLCVGLGTGLAYGACNLPVLFQAQAPWQAVVAAVVALTASFAVSPLRSSGETSLSEPGDRGTEAAWIVILAALVSLDSAAFYIIQHVPSLQSGTWGGPAALWGNAAMHFLAAVAAGWAFDRDWRGRLVALALLLLAAACAALVGGSTGVLPGLLYTAGVSLYSVVLVAYPALAARPWFSARVFALAGWLGSALGIGLVLGRTGIPVDGIAAAAALGGGALLFLRSSRRSAATLLSLPAFLALSPQSVRAATPDDESDIQRGREVYIAEGCINCHSQYVRPQVAADVEQWGPAAPLVTPDADSPPLYGNRRQGPDLTNVGLRRSPVWNRLHLLNPRTVSPGSVMPAYAHLFADGDSRGPDLLSYLASLGQERAAERADFVTHWQPQALPAGGTTGESRALFAELCARCHGPAGRGDGVLRGELVPAPPDWSSGLRHRPPPGEDELTYLARLIKFGLPGSSMAGHEYLPDRTVLGLARYVQSLPQAARGGHSP